MAAEVARYVPSNSSAPQLNGVPLQQITAFQPSRFTPPYRSAINPHFTEKTDEWYNNWLVQMRADKVLSPKGFNTQITMDTPKLCALSHPITLMGKWGLEWIIKYTGLIFVLDDVADSTEVGKDLQASLSMSLDVNLIMAWTFPDDPVVLSNIYQLVDLACSERESAEKKAFIEEMLVEARSKPGTAYPRDVSDGPAKCLFDLWEDGLKKSSRNSMLTIAHCTQHWLLGVLQEACVRKESIVPDSIEHFIKIRQRTAATYSFTLAAEVTCGLDSPQYWINLPEMEQALDAASDLVGWDNDVWSFIKEAYVEKDVSFNMIGVISRFKSVPYQEAGQILAKMMEQRIVDMDASLRDLEKKTPPELKHNFDIYVEIFHFVVGGCDTWYKESSRYRKYQVASEVA